MKIINAKDAGLQEIPFSLGEAKKASHFEEVGISMDPDQTPTGPDAVGFVMFDGHCMLTKLNPDQRGVLVRINTNGIYTRGSHGYVSLLGGDAKMLVSGAFAYGDAGNIGGASDELWHIQGPALFQVYLSGGARKGFGERFLIVTKSFRVIMRKEDEICQIVAADQDPEVTAVIRMFADKATDGMREALETAEILEQNVTSLVSVKHFSLKPLAQAVADMGIAVPNSDEIAGVGGVKAGTLLPGDKSLVSVTIGPGGGKRYSFAVVTEVGITRLKSRCEKPHTSEEILAMVESDDWMIAWQDIRDGKIMAVSIANSGGIHHYGYPNLDHAFTEEWIGIAQVAPDLKAVAKIFGLEEQKGGENDISPDGAFAAALAKAKIQ